jgi:hypothetical protein
MCQRLAQCSRSIFIFTPYSSLTFPVFPRTLRRGAFPRQKTFQITHGKYSATFPSSFLFGGEEFFPFAYTFFSPCQILLFFSSFSPIYPSFAFVLSLFSARSPLILLFLSKCLMFPSTSPSLNVLWTSFKYFLLLPTRRLSRCL